MLQVDTIHRYMLIWSACWAQCRIRIYEHAGRQVVICSEAMDSRDMSITSYAEDLAEQVVRRYRLEPKRLVWIEHHPPVEADGETFDRVYFRWNGGQPHHPHWQRLTLEDLERLTGDQSLGRSAIDTDSHVEQPVPATGQVVTGIRPVPHRRPTSRQQVFAEQSSKLSAGSAEVAIPRVED